MKQCLSCSGEIGINKSSHAEYCSKSCKNLAYTSRNKERYLSGDLRRPAVQLWREILIEILGFTCSICGSKEKIEVDHITPLFNGGKNSIKNIALLCKKHHQEKTKKESLNPHFSSSGLKGGYQKAKGIAK